MRWALLVVLAVGCGKSVSTETAQPDHKAKEVKPRDFAANFDALAKWCEQSLTEVDVETQANPIRGEELSKSEMDQLRNELLGKTIRWRLKIQNIDPGGKVFLRSYYTVKVKNPNSRDSSAFLILAARFQEQKPIGGWDYSAAQDLTYSIGNIPLQKLRNLSVGDYVSVVGKITGISKKAGHYEIEVRDSIIE